jgi:hypothetical protein
MTAADFNTLVVALWGDGWRLRLDDLLRKHSYRYSRQTFYNWQKGRHPIPEPIILILKKESKKKGTPI